MWVETFKNSFHLFQLKIKTFLRVTFLHLYPRQHLVILTWLSVHQVRKTLGIFHIFHILILIFRTGSNVYTIEHKLISASIKYKTENVESGTQQHTALAVCILVLTHE